MRLNVMLYLGVFTISAAIRGVIASRQVWVSAYWALLVFLFLFVAFRFDVGCDWGSYVGIFYAEQSSTVADAFETRQPFYVISLLALGDLGFSYLSFNVLGAVLFFAGIAVMARRQVDPLAFLILCFPVLIINMPMSGVRQGIAIGLMCVAYMEFARERTVPYVIWVALAAAFHSSAMVFLALTPLIPQMSIHKRIGYILVLLVPGVLALLGTETFEVANSRYLESDLESGGALFRILPLTICGLLWGLVLRREWLQRFPKDAKLAMVGVLMMVGVIALMPLSSVIADRIAYYLMPLQAMIFARIPFLDISLRRIWSIAPYAMLLVLFIAWSQLSSHFDTCYLP
ncbi:MAG: EpsG family protein, partial [Pontixanthobacter sp.]